MALIAQIGETQVTLDEKSEVIDIGHNSYHLIEDNVCHTATILAQDGKQVTLEVNGHTYTVDILDDIDQLVESMGLDKVVAQKASSLKAPMPGLILDILVKPGDQVTSGTKLLVLEAMKMENMITSEGEGVVKDIAIKKGDIVEKNQLLIELE